jgi:hypothetical protein
MAPESTAPPETEQVVSVNENPVPEKVTVLPIATGVPHGVSVNPTVKLVTTISPNGLPVTVTGFEPGATHPTTKLPLTIPAATEQMTPVTAPPSETVQVVSVNENPVPVKITLLPVPLVGSGDGVMVWAPILGSSEVTVEMSNTSTIRILLAVLRVEP